MLCNWLTKTNVLIHATRKALALKRCPSGTWHNASQPYLRITSSYHSFQPVLPTQGLPALPYLHSNLHPSTDLPSTSLTTPPSLHVDDLTSAQVSRASAVAVRISVARGDIWDGFHLWHSLRWSMHHYHKPGPNSSSRLPFHTPISAFEPINFGLPVSARLSGHCLLHGLLRAGNVKMAAKLARQMMAYGEELHPLSFNTILRQLHLSATHNTHRTVYNRLQSLTPRPKMPVGSGVLALRNVMPADPFTYLAVRLLIHARKHRWQRTTGMYESVLRACLTQGEILVASLLLALLLKDYQLRHACSRLATEADKMGVPDPITYVHANIPDAPSRGFKRLPDNSSHLLFQSITGFLQKHCAHVDDPLFPEASQALANVASALDARRIPYANLASLIKALYSYPQCHHTIWITLPSGERQLRNAYRYFHGVLLNILRFSLDQRALGLNTSAFPALDLGSYHALLNYAMRYRHSLPLANRVLHHMTELRRPQLAPSMATYNILFRSSTLMRRNDIAESVLEVIWSRIPITGHSAVALHFPHSTSQGRNSRIETGTANLKIMRHRLRFRGLLEDTRKYDLTIPKPKGLLKPDITLLTSYMAYLVATGRPEAVETVIAQVIPEFTPPEEDTTPEELIARWGRSVVHGVTLGPHFFAVALNALRKAGRRKLAERVWILARAAETKSLQSGDKAPWCLSVHAYTAMLQLYAHETRGRHVGNTATYTRSSAETRRSLDPGRAMLGIRKGMAVFRALPLASDRVREATVRACMEGREWKRAPTAPIPDARFYNAALSLVSRQPGMCPRGPRPGSRRRWDQKLSKARQRFLLTGQRPRGWTPELEEIAKSLRESGYALPIGFRIRLVGRDEQVILQEKIDLGARPYSFGRRSRARSSPHRIPTVKRKGLPLRRRWSRLRWSNVECDDAPRGTVAGVK